MRIHALLSSDVKLVRGHPMPHLHSGDRGEANQLCAWTWGTSPLKRNSLVTVLPLRNIGSCGFNALNYDLNKIIYYGFFNCLFKKDGTSADFLLSLNISCLLYNLPLFTTFSPEPRKKT